MQIGDLTIDAIIRFIYLSLLICAGLVLVVFIQEWLWNHVLLNIFPLHSISFWQMLGLELFVSMLSYRVRSDFSTKE